MAEWLNARRKTITALVTGLIGWAATYAVADDQWIALSTVIAMAVGVYAVPNKTAN